MRGQRLSALAVGTLAAFGTVPGVAEAATAATANTAQGAVPAAATTTEPATELILEAQPNDPVTGGFNGVISSGLTAQGYQDSQTTNHLGSDVYFTATMPPSAASGNAQWLFQGWLSSGSGVDFAAGQTYTYVYGHSLPYVDTRGLGTCSGYTGGDFTVYQVAYSGATLTKFEAVFTQYCSNALEARGVIRYNATGPLPAGAPTGKPPASQGGTVEPMTFRRDAQIISAAAGATDGIGLGTPGTYYGDSLTGQTAWSPLGTRVFVTNSTSITVERPDGSDAHQLTQPPGGNFVGVDEEPAVSPDGSTLAFVRGASAAYPGGAVVGGGLMMVTTDGSDTASPYQVPLNGGTCTNVHTPNFAPDGSLIYECDNGGTAPAVYHRVRGASAQLIANAAHAVYSPDGTKIAFVRDDAKGTPQVFTVAADGSTGLAQVTTDPNGAAKPAWSPDGRYLAYVNTGFHEIVEIPSGGGSPVGSIPNADDPDWTTPIATTHVIREWGGDRVSTAIAASQIDFADAGNVADVRRSQANAVVLSRSDQYADALGGSSLAVRKDAPLLITGTSALDPAVSAEIGRVLKPGGTVYLLGGTAALSPAVASALSGTGYNVVRLAGPERYATAVAIAKAVDPQPKLVLVATGANFPDALAAGATGEPLVLSAGATMPAATAAYLNTLNPSGASSGGTTVATIGGPGDAAVLAGYQAGKMPSWPSQVSRIKLAGNSRYDTALLVARTFFGGETDAALATGLSWPDALSGGAMIGHRGGPLLLTDPAGESPALLDYLGQESGSLYAVHLLGGRAALPDTIANQAASVMGLPGHVQIGSLSPGGVFPMKAPALPGSGSVPVGAAAGVVPDALSSRSVFAKG